MSNLLPKDSYAYGDSEEIEPRGYAEGYYLEDPEEQRARILVLYHQYRAGIEKRYTKPMKHWTEEGRAGCLFCGGQCVPADLEVLGEMRESQECGLLAREFAGAHHGLVKVIRK